MKRDLEIMSKETYDLLIVGGGITGACLAWDATLKGLKVALVEKSDFHFEEILTITRPVLSDNDEYIYTLSHHYIKGYLDNLTGRFIENMDFNPRYEPPVYIENYKRLMRRDER